MTVALRCAHGLQLRDGEDAKDENLPEHGPWTFADGQRVELLDIVTCLVCQTRQEVIGVIADRLVPMDDMGRLMFDNDDEDPA
jgi:hypothetical protein